MAWFEDNYPDFDEETYAKIEKRYARAQRDRNATPEEFEHLDRKATPEEFK